MIVIIYISYIYIQSNKHYKYYNIQIHLYNSIYIPQHLNNNSTNTNKQMQQKQYSSNNNNDYNIQSYYIKFESNDSQVSDGSYQSSLSSNQQKNTNNIQYFREEMSRFFINYPELMNNQLLLSEKNINNSNNGNNSNIYKDNNNKKQQQQQNKAINNNKYDYWSSIANQIFDQTKQDEVSLQSIAKRIAYYRRKAQQVDIIDLIAKQKDAILKQLDEQATVDVNENILIYSNNNNGNNQGNNNIGVNGNSNNINGNIGKQQNQKRTSSLFGHDSTENTYFSWKKRNQRDFRNNVQRSSRRGKSTEPASYIYKQNNANNVNSVNKDISINKDINNNTPKQYNRKQSIATPTNVNNNNKLYSRFSTMHNTTRKQPKQTLLTTATNNNTYQNNNNNNNKYKNILKIQPKTQAGKQLFEQLRKLNISNNNNTNNTNNYMDQILIKKTIVQFIAKYRENLQKQMIQKATLPQRLSKLHIEDSKQLLLFCPIKKKTNAQTDMPLNKETDEFIQILRQISQGNLMKYWRLLQQKKL